MGPSDALQNTVVQAEPAHNPSEITWLVSGAILPCFSARFYLEAAKRKASKAVWFFILFGLICATLATLGMTRTMLQFGGEIHDAYAQGKIPAVRIRNGIASVNGPQPAILFNQNRTAVIIDTTGSITHLDPARYDNGFLLTRTTLQVISSSGRDQTIPLAQLNQAFSTDLIVIDGDGVTRLWNEFSVGMGILFWFGTMIWNSLVSLGYLALLALLVSVIFRLFQPRAAYAPVFVVGAYAYVPALYLSILLKSIQFQFFAMQTVIWLVIWLVALALALRQSRLEIGGESFSLLTWRTWIGIPMVAAFALNAIFPLNDQVWILWVVAVGTLMVLVVIDLIKTLKSETSSAG